MPSEEPEVLFERRGTAGIVTLNRPAALNAVTAGMVRLLHEQLAAWRDDPAVTRVLVTAAGDRAFSAGGDLRGILRGRPGRTPAGTRWRSGATNIGSISRSSITPSPMWR